MYQIFALHFHYVNYENNKEKREAYLNDWANFFKNFKGGPIIRVENFNAHMEGAILPASLFSDYSKNYSAEKIKIEVERAITKEEFNEVLKQYAASDRASGIKKIEAIEELSN